MKPIPMGMKTVLFGAHCWPIHTVMVFIAWTRLYGFPWDPRVWLAIMVHDLGYLVYRTRDIDGEEGERHPFFGARVMRVFGRQWYEFVLYHSRFLAQAHGKPVSPLCVADKYAVALTPAWLYLPLVRLTGEIKEYQALAEHGKYANLNIQGASDSIWYRDMQRALRRWVREHAREQTEKMTN